MAEYISKEAALQKFFERGSGYINMLTMKTMIDEIPAADVQLVVHGYWEECEIRGTLTQSCSVCGNDCGVLYPYDFCPNCGARMDE